MNLDVAALTGVTCAYTIEPSDPTTTTSKKAPGAVLVYNFPQGTLTYSGNENILDGTGVISDHLRWIDPSGSDLACPASSGIPCATRMIFYSMDTGIAPADTGPIAFSLAVPSVNEDANGNFTYTSPLGNIFVGVSGVSAIPLPPTFSLFATGLGTLGLLGWRRKRKAQAI